VLKKLTALFISVLLVVGCMAMPVSVSAADATTVTYTLSSGHGYFVGRTDGRNDHGTIGGTGKVDVSLPLTNVVDSVYDMYVRITNGAGKSHIIFSQDGNIIGTGDVLIASGTNHWARVGSVKLSGSKFDFTMAADNAVNINEFRFVPRTDLTEPEPSGAISLTYSGAVAKSNAGTDSDLLEDGWAQFELPQGYAAGDYMVVMNIGANAYTTALRFYLDGQTAETGTDPQNQIYVKKNVFSNWKNNTYTSLTNKVVGVVSLDGTNRYLGIKTSSPVKFDSISLMKTDISDTVDSCSLDPINDYYSTSHASNAPAMNRSGSNRLESGDWVAYKVTVAESGTYNFEVGSWMNKASTFTLYLGNAGGVSQGAQTAEAGIADNNNDIKLNTWTVNLTQGDNFLRIANSGVARQIAKVTISKVQSSVYEQTFTTQDRETLKEDSLALSGISDSNVVTGNRYFSFWSMSNGSYVTYEFEIPKPGIYRISAMLGVGNNTIGGSATVQMDIDGDEYRRSFTSSQKFSVASEIAFADRVFTKAGKYTVKLTKKTGATVNAMGAKIKYVGVAESEPDDYAVDILPSENVCTSTEGIAENETFDSSTYVNANPNPYTMDPDSSLAWSFIPAHNGKYEFSFVSNAAGDVFVNDKPLNKKDSAYDEINLFAGEEYIVRYENNTGSDITLTSGRIECVGSFESGVVLKSLELQNADGVRFPYAVTDGLKVYAAAEICKVGSSEDTLKLIVAQYDSTGNLVCADSEAIDVSAMNDKEIKTFRKEITVEGEGGKIKGFLLDEETLTPLSKADVRYDAVMFDESDFSDTVTPENAKSVLASYGEYDSELYNNISGEGYTIEPIFYDSVVGEQEKVFAYLGIPDSASVDNKVPAVVLVHGAGASATGDIGWVRQWNEKGYAAIAIDLYGKSADYTGEGSTKIYIKHPFAGIEPWGDAGEAFQADKEKAGMYQNIINVVNAHTLLSRLEVIDSERIGIVGYSNGAVTTTVAMGVDDRFAFAVPVYGGGYLDHTKTYMAQSAFYSGVGTSLLWDPANFAAQAKMPVLYINNNWDSAFSVDTTSWTYSVTPDAYISLRSGYAHSGGVAADTDQIYDFADEICKNDNASPYARITNESVDNGYLTADIDLSDNEVVKATLHYIKSEEVPFRSTLNPGASPWDESTVDVTNSISDGNISISVPDDATYCYVTIEHVAITGDYSADGICVSTKLLKVK